MRHSTEQEILKVPIKVIEPGHLIMKHRSYEFSFLIKHNEQASAVQLASQPDLYEEPQTLNYKFKDDAYTAGTDIHFEYFKVKSILFPKFKEKSHFKLLSREGLYDIPTEPFLKKEKLVDFLQNIGCHWFEFMTKKIVVRPEYLKELMILDFKLAVEDFLQKKTAPTHETIEERSLRMQNYEKHIFQMLEIDKIAKLTRGELMIETNPKLRVQIMCDEQFKAYADINLKSAKEKSLFDCFGLSGESCALENQTLQMMAEIMILMDNQKLNLDMRRFQGEFYELNEALLREKLLDIPPGQDLESC
ncbi:uncharacterized protein LOC134848375 [Symsagittifera roscoffensis]|uniref:uncharacterized protein LOC134848375 n=1 Tax=Symsagittifera roscoffensis TaxID=84072 RepID=UPI00307B9EF5